MPGPRRTASGADLAPPSVHVMMHSQEMLEGMMRSYNEEGSHAIGLTPPGSSMRVPLSNTSVESVNSTPDRGQNLFSNAVRKTAILDFVNFVQNSKQGSASWKKNIHSLRAPSNTSIGAAENIIEASFALGRWSMDRFHTVMRDVRDASYRNRPTENLATSLESLHWAMCSNASADEGREDEEADSQVWNRYCVAFQSCHGPVPQPTDPESVLKLLSMRSDALEHFHREVETELRRLSSDELEATVLYITKYRMAPSLMDLICPVVFKRLPEETITRDVIPRFMVLAVLQPDAVGSGILQSLLARWHPFVKENAVNSALEYSAHLQRPNCARVLLDNWGSMIAAEGVIAALIPTCARGTDHLLAMLELFVMDKCQQLTEKNLREGNGAAPSNHSDTPDEAFGDLVPPCCYMFLVLAAGGGYAKPGTLSELIEFYLEPCAALLVDRISEENHIRFTHDLFYLACQLNFTAIVWTLLKAGWHPVDCTPALRQATELGHQSLVHILLDALLTGDEEAGGNVPVVFRRSGALILLPEVARRFPAEAVWFLQQLSSLPIPPCVPLGENQEAEVRATAIQGTRLGIATLAEVTRRTETLTPISTVWKRLSMSAELRSTAMSPADAECVICMAPEALLTQFAAGPRFSRKTSPFIRLLETGNEEIILQPLMQALMEYHWIHGNFWYRFAAHFALSLAFIGCMWGLFVLTIKRQVYMDDEYGALIPLTCLVFFFTALFVTQECRECLDNPSDYIRSFSNMMDMMVYTSVMVCAIRGSLLDLYVPPLLLGFTLVVYCTRILMQLRIIPSVGPIIRIWVSATTNIFPVLVPFCVLAISFAGAFHLIQMPLISTSSDPNTLHFLSIPESIQSVLTMTAGDYSVLDFAENPEVFSLRLLFHVIFIIFLINLIIGLMTVNVANVTTNTTGAWLVEIAQLMVELELYWPWPMGYTNQSGGFRERLRNSGAAPDKELSSSPGFLRRLFRSSRKGGNKVLPEHSTPTILVTVPLPADKNGHDSGVAESGEELASLQQRLVLYTCPEDQVAQTHWWKIVRDKNVAKAGATDSGTGSHRSLAGGHGGGGGGGGIHHQPSGIATLFGLRDNRDQHVASVPSLVGRSASTLPPVPSAGDHLRLPSEIWTEQEDDLTTEETTAAFNEIRNRRSSRVEKCEPKIGFRDRDKSATTSGYELGSPTINLKEVVDQLSSLKEAVRTLEKIMHADAKTVRDRTQKLELILNQDRQISNDASAATNKLVLGLSSDIKELAAVMKRPSPLPVADTGLRRMFLGNRSAAALAPDA